MNVFTTRLFVVSIFVLLQVSVSSCQNTLKEHEYDQIVLEGRAGEHGYKIMRGIPEDEYEGENLKKVLQPQRLYLDRKPTGIAEGTRLVEPEDIYQFKNAVSLYIDGNWPEFLNAVDFTELKEVREVICRASIDEAVLQNILQCPNLIRVKISATPKGGTFHFPENIGKLKKLQELYFHTNGRVVVPKSFAELPLKRLSLAGLQGKLPEGIAGLQELELLELSNFQVDMDMPFNGKDFEEYAHNIRLDTVLSSASMREWEEVQFFDMSGVEKIKSLRKLSLNGLSSLTLPKRLGDLKSLESLEIKGGFLAELPASYDELESLKEIVISGTWIRSFPPSENLGNLLGVDLKAMPYVQELPHFTGSPKLVFLGAEKCDIREVPDWIDQFPNLKCLMLSNNRKLTRVSPNINNSKIEKLSLERTGLEEWPTNLGSLPYLNAINIKGTKIDVEDAQEALLNVMTNDKRLYSNFYQSSNSYRNGKGELVMYNSHISLSIETWRDCKRFYVEKKFGDVVFGWRWH